MSHEASAWALKAKCSSAIEKSILMVVASYVGPDGTCFPSHKTISDLSCASLRSVVRALASFEDRGWIERRERRRRDGSRTSDLIVFTAMTHPEKADLQGATVARCGDSLARGHATVAHLTTFEPVIEYKDIVVSEEPTLSPSPRRSYPDAFEEAWKAYPHHKGRSSKPKALAEWKRMPAQERDSLMGAIRAFTRNVDKVCGGMGAPCMARWMNHGKHLNWIEEASAAASPSPSFVKTWNGPDRLREMVVRERGEGFAVSYIDRATWDGSAIIAHNDLAVGKLKDVHCLANVVIKNNA